METTINITALITTLIDNTVTFVMANLGAVLLFASGIIIWNILKEWIWGNGKDWAGIKGI